MRIIAGKFKSRRINVPKGVELRPTSDRVKESLFGILGTFLIDKDVLDLYSGTGNLGIEALSRGARTCVFTDSNGRCVSEIKKTLEYLGITEGVQILLRDALRYIKDTSEKGVSYDLIFLDPPYHHDMIKKSLITLDNYNIIRALSVVVAEHYRKDDLPAPEELKNMEMFRQEKYGGTMLSFYRLKRAERADET